MGILSIIGLILGGLVLGFLILGVVIKKDFQLERSIVINASPEQIFPHVQYFTKRNAWYPWYKMDPDIKTKIEGEDGVIGTTSSWEGNKQVGRGQQTLTVVEPHKRVDTKLVFLEPWQSEANAYLIIDEVDRGSRTRWGFVARFPFPFNVMTLFMNMDKSVGNDYANGLRMLKDIVENEVHGKSIHSETNKPNQTPMYKIEQTEFPETHFVAIRETVKIEDLSAGFQTNLPKVYKTLVEQGHQPAGMPHGMYYDWNEKEGTTDVAYAIPVKEKIDLGEGFTSLHIPKTPVAALDFYGSYEKLKDGHGAVHAYIHEHKLGMANPAIEEYATDPELEPDPNKWLTKIYYPING